MYPLSLKPIRDRLHRQACERMEIEESQRLNELPITAHLYNVTVQDVAVERIAELEDALTRVLEWFEHCTASGRRDWGPVFYDGMIHQRNRLREANAGSTTTRQPDDG